MEPIREEQTGVVAEQERESPYILPPPEESGGSLRHLSLPHIAILIVAGIFATTLAQPAVVGSLPLRHLLLARLHVSQIQMASFFFLVALPWYFKPFAGILSDAFPLFGTRRRYYLLVSAAGATVLWLVLGVVPKAYSSLLYTAIGINVFMVVASSVIGGILVEAGQRLDATGRLTSLRYLVMNTCTLINGPLGGYLAGIPFFMATSAGAAMMFTVVPVAFFFLREAHVAQRDTAVLKDAKQQLINIARSGTFWMAALLLAFVYIAPGFGTPLYYKQTNELKFSQQFIGYLGIYGGAAGIVGAALYGFFVRKITLRNLIYISIACNVVSTLFYLGYRSAGHAIVIETGNGLFATLAEIPLMDLAARATPRGSEAMGFALMMSVRNFMAGLSDIIGSWLIQNWHLSFSMLVFVNAGTTALVLLFIPLLPAILVRHREGEKS